MSTVTEYFADRELDFLAFDHPRSFSSLEEAEALGVDPADVAKTVVLDTVHGHVIAVIPATRRLDLKAAGAAVGDRHARLASEEEIEKDFPGFELGAVPPVASLVSAPVIFDPELTTREFIVFASGKQTESVKIRMSDLLFGANIRVAPLTHPEAAADEDWME